MVFYHADTHGHLSLGQTMDLFHAVTPISSLYPSGVSAFGERVFLRAENDTQRMQQWIELLFDYCRRANYPHLPSRFTCVYASARPEDSRSWIEEIASDGASCPVYAVECSTAYIADARFLDCGSTLPNTLPDLLNLLHFADGYFQSFQRITSETNLPDMRFFHKPELLLVPPVRVLYRV